MASKKIAIVGSGVAGLACAYYCLERGHEVVVLERGPQGHDCCSLGNAGFISPSHFIPLAAPGVVGKALRWLADPESPFWVRPRLDAAFLGWAFRFWRSSRPEVARRAAPLLRDLNLASRSLYQELARRTGNAFQLTEEGLLVLFRSEKALAVEAGHAAFSRELGMPAEVRDRAGIAALEPEIHLDVVGGVLYPLDAHVTPQRFCEVLERLVRERGGAFVWASEVTGWRSTGRRVEAAVTPSGEHRADEFVVAAGAASAAVLRPLGLRLALEPGKGYSLTLPDPPERPRRSLILQEARVAITPMGSTLRVGGTMELGASRLGVNPPRIRGIVRATGCYLPALTPSCFRGIEPWSGLRPCTPDGLPYIGRSARYDNLLVATGHAMLGLSMGPVTGSLIASVVSGERPAVDLGRLRPERFA